MEAIERGFEQAEAFLRQNPLQFAAHLKLLNGDRRYLACTYWKENGETGIILSYPTETMPTESRVFEGAQAVLLPVITSHSLAPRLADLLPQDTPVIFQFSDTLTAVAVGHLLPLIYADSDVIYSVVTHWQHQTSKEVVAAQTLGTSPVFLYREQGYSAQDLAKIFATGKAVTFTRYTHGIAVSTCLVLTDHNNLHRITALYTEPSYRQQGYAREVLQTALGWLLMRGATPYTIVPASNVLAQHLMTTVGMERRYQLSHYITDGVKWVGLSG